MPLRGGRFGPAEAGVAAVPAAAPTPRSKQIVMPKKMSFLLFPADQTHVAFPWPGPASGPRGGPSIRFWK